MKRFLRDRLVLGLAIVACLGLGLAVAQNINKSVQLSQDASGPIGFDTNNNVYFPAHILTSGPGTPTLSTNCSTATIRGTDTAGTMIGVTATTGTCSVTFSKAYLTTPFCIATTQNPATSPLAYNIVPTGLNFTTITGAVTANYICSGLS